jgi:arylsulfatase A-like enzyme
MRGFRHRRTITGSLCTALVAALALVWQAQAGTGQKSGGDSQAEASSSTAANSGSTADGSGKHPNILYVLTDDLSWNLVKYMPHVRQMMEKGTTFPNYFATDSLCCPSRSTIFTSEYPHNTGVYANTGADGGFRAFMRHGNDKKCFGPRMQEAGYSTGFMGKYLNGYRPAAKRGSSKPYVPQGWDHWLGVGHGGYAEYNYKYNENGQVKKGGDKSEDYLTDVISKKASEFISSSAKQKKPFMLETSTFAPHSPSTPAPQDEKKFRGLKAPRNSAYGKATENAPKWQQELDPLTTEEKETTDRKFAKRVRSVQAVDRMIGNLQKAVEDSGQADNTYIMFGSDNGFHMGEHRLRPGKLTAYDTDINVPLMVTGPGVPAGKKVSQLAQNTDLNPTFQDLAGLKPSSTEVDGSSLADLMHGKSPGDWRKSVLVEHHHENRGKELDPDRQKKDEGDPPDYNAIRTDEELYVEYSDGEREYYTLKTDPNEMNNKVDSLSAEKKAALHKKLMELHHCKGEDACKKASK